MTLKQKQSQMPRIYTNYGTHQLMHMLRSMDFNMHPYNGNMEVCMGRNSTHKLLFTYSNIVKTDVTLPVDKHVMNPM